jgi:hypothetical protein
MLSVGQPAFTFVLVFIGFLPFEYDHRLSDGPSLDLNPAFKFVLVFIVLLLSIFLRQFVCQSVTRRAALLRAAWKLLCDVEIGDQETH